MDDPNKHLQQESDIKTLLPDVVHSQQIRVLGPVESEEAPQLVTSVDQSASGCLHGEDVTDIESISEHIPSKCDYSVTESYHGDCSPLILKVDDDPNKSSQNSLNQEVTPISKSINVQTENNSKQSTSLPININAISDVQLLSDESPIILPLSSDKSSNPDDDSNSEEKLQAAAHDSTDDTPKASPQSEYIDSLNDEISNESLSEGDKISKKLDSKEKSSSSEEIIKLDIRGHGVPKFPLTATDIIFGPPPEGSTIIPPNVEPLPVFQNLLSPFLVGATDSVKIEEVFDYPVPQPKDISPQNSDESSLDKIEETDLLVEEMVCEMSPTVDITVNEEEKLRAETERDKDDRIEDSSIPTQPKSMAPEETMSFSTLSTDYKTICEEYHAKLVHLEDAITQRDQLIEELTVSLQRSTKEQHNLKLENEYLTNEVQNLQHVVSEKSLSDHDTIKAQISDFMKYQSMIKDDSTKFYSAVMSAGSSAQSSNGEKDMDREEITINHSRSDLKTSESSDEFQVGFESKLVSLVSKFDEYIEENMRNKLREGLIQILCDEIGKMKLDFDTDLKELESQMQQDQQAYTKETNHLRELLENVKAGNADIDALRKELNIKHEKEMANLRMYFEKKCSDMERSYSEEVWRGRACESPADRGDSWDKGDSGDRGPRGDSSERGPEPGGAGDAAGDHVRRARSADLPSLTDDVWRCSRGGAARVEDVVRAHRAVVDDLQLQISQLKAQLHSAENGEGKLSLYPQDIDLELEKAAQFEKRLDEVRQEVVQELQEKIQVLLSDPDAEVSSWPLELVALRDKIQGAHDKELSVREDPEADKWRQRRNSSFDQSRRLEEITKERDGLRRVATQLQRALRQLLQYCASAEDELNHTVLASLLPPAAEDSAAWSPELVVHLAPELQAELSASGAELQAALDRALARLRTEAAQLLALVSRRGAVQCDESRMLECSEQSRVTELVEEMDQRSSRNQLHNKSMEEALADSLEREQLLRSELEAAMMKIASLMMSVDDEHHTHVIAEGYGVVSSPCSRPARQPSPPASPSSPAASPSPRTQYCAVIDALTKERDDLQQQLEAANRQLRSTRQFVEEQAAEREAERDEYSARVRALLDENQRLTSRLTHNARILTEMYGLVAPAQLQHQQKVEQLEAQTREMSEQISSMESHKAAADDALKASEEKVALLRDIVADLEHQLDQKISQEQQIISELEVMKQTIDSRDAKMRSLLQEIQDMRLDREGERERDSTCAACACEGDKYSELMDQVKQECHKLEEHLYERCRVLERSHEQCSQPCSEPSEDVSIREQKQTQAESVGSAVSAEWAESAWRGAWAAAAAAARAEDAALKRLADLDMQRAALRDLAQEIRAERDVLQARMSEQALKMSSLSARLEQQRNEASAAAHSAHSLLRVQLHDTRAEVERLKDELDSKDKQLARAKQALEERSKQDQHVTYGNACNPKDKVMFLERELSSAQSRLAQLEADKDALQTETEILRTELADRDAQLQQLLAIKLNDEQKDKSEVEAEKVSARTLSDIVSISEFDEQDLQMRRAEMRAHNFSLTGAPYVNDTRDKSHLYKTLPPDVQRANMSSLNIELEHSDLPHSPRADSLPAHLTSTQNKHFLKDHKRNVNETTVFGNIDKFGDSVKHSTAQNIPDNCSLYPNRDVSDNKNVSIEPKKINFSLEASKDNKNEEEFTSLRELGITLDIRQENFPDILTQLKHEIKKSRTELEKSKSELKKAEEQLCEFPALKEEVEELKTLLENTMATMKTDKKFYENQLDSFSSNKKLLEQRLTELTQEVSDKTKDLHLLKEDILRRENMILELAKEKRNLTNKLSELKLKIDELERANTKLDNVESENRQLKDKLAGLQKLEQLISEKNQQIDSLNQHLDRLDDLQRCLHDKTEEMDALKETLHDKSNEVFQLQNTVQALTQDIAKANEENTNLNTVNNDLKQVLTKLQKEQENASLKLQSNDGELQRLNSINSELTSKIDELKLITDKLKDKETEVDILNEDINSYHEEIASLKEQLQMVSRSPSPRSKAGAGDDRKQTDRQASSDKKQLVKIRKQISLLQHELDFNKKELNDKAFELAKAKLDVTELRNSLSQASKLASDKDAASNVLSQQVEGLQREVEELRRDKEELEQQLEIVATRLREESNVDELKAKIQDKVERCNELEMELQEMKEIFERVAGGRRSPTLQLEQQVRAQLQHAAHLDQRLQRLLAPADHRVPPLHLPASSSSSMQSSTSEHVSRLHNENDKLQLQVDHLEARLKDKDALIAELNTVRDKLLQESESLRLRLQAEHEGAARLQLLLLRHKDSADSLQKQDSNMIEILKKRLESAMRTEAEVRERERDLRATVTELQERESDSSPVVSPKKLTDTTERLKGEISILRARLECEREKAMQLESELERARYTASRDVDIERDKNSELIMQLAALKREKQESCMELARARELVSSQKSTIAALQRDLQLVAGHARPVAQTLTEIESHKSSLAQEIAALKLHVAAARAAAPDDDKEQAIRYLHGRCLRLESCRKALVWQKRYLLRVLSGYSELERSLQPAPASPATGKARFKLVALAALAACRLAALVRRRARARAAAARLVIAPRDQRPNQSALVPGVCTSSPAPPGYRPSPQHTQHFILSSPRGEAGAAYMNKLSVMSRCLYRDTP